MNHNDAKQDRASLRGNERIDESAGEIAQAQRIATASQIAQAQRIATNGEIEKAKQMASGTFWDYLGGRIVSVDGRRCVAELEIKSHHLNIFGMVHGGVYSSLLDSVMGVVVMASRPGQGAVTTNLNVHFTAPLSQGRVRVEADIVHAASRTITAEGRVLDENGTLCAFGTGTFRIVGDKLQPR